MTQELHGFVDTNLIKEPDTSPPNCTVNGSVSCSLSQMARVLKATCYHSTFSKHSSFTPSASFCRHQQLSVWTGQVSMIAWHSLGPSAANQQTPCVMRRRMGIHTSRSPAILTVSARNTKNNGAKWRNEDLETRQRRICWKNGDRKLNVETMFIWL